jgi:hypothetical protein
MSACIVAGRNGIAASVTASLPSARTVTSGTTACCASAYRFASETVAVPSAIPRSVSATTSPA